MQGILSSISMQEVSDICSYLRQIIENQKRSVERQAATERQKEMIDQTQKADSDTALNALRKTSSLCLFYCIYNCMYLLTSMH